VRLVAPLTPSPEGVAVCADGSVFVTLDASAEVWRVPLDGGAPERWASLGGWQPAGIACDERGRLFVAAFANRSDSATAPTVLLVSERDAEVRALPGPSDGTALGGLNGIVAIPGLGVYATDTLAHVVVRVRESAPDTFETTVVAREVNGGNGLAYDAANAKLYAVASLAKTLFSFDVAADGTLGERALVPTPASMAFLDGVAVDERGAAYVTDYVGGSVIRVTDGASVATVTNPASLAFRGGTLLITDYKIGSATQAGGLYAAELGVCGAAR
jgi:sugar lactone lactonase YvrE